MPRIIPTNVVGAGQVNRNLEVTDKTRGARPAPARARRWARSQGRVNVSPRFPGGYPICWKADRLDRLEKLKGSFAVVLVRCLQRCFDIRVRYAAAARLSPQKLNRSASGGYRVEKLSTLPLSDDKKFHFVRPSGESTSANGYPTFAFDSATD